MHAKYIRNNKNIEFTIIANDIASDNANEEPFSLTETS